MLALGLATATTAVAIGLAAGLGWRELGLRPDRWRPGLVVGAAAFVAISAVVAVGGLAGVIADDRADVGWSAMLLRVLVLIPVGTVLVEELIFRGALHGLLLRVTGTPAGAVWWGAVVFGLWHVIPASRGGAVDAISGAGTAGAVLLTFVATATAGLVLGWLRMRTDGLAAPALAHLATNSVTFVVAWLTAGG